MEKQLKQSQSALGHDFSNLEVFVCALTHRSLAHELAQGNEKDALAVTPETTSALNFWAMRYSDWWSPRLCLSMHPEWREGELTIPSARRW